MEKNEVLRKEIFNILDNQLEDNNPPETKNTYERLRKLDFDDFQTRQMIGQCIAVEIFEIIKFGKKYDTEGYVSNLKNLPKEPFE